MSGRLGFLPDFDDTPAERARTAAINRAADLSIYGILLGLGGAVVTVTGLLSGSKGATKLGALAVCGAGALLAAGAAGRARIK